MSGSRVAIRYAKSLFDLALEQNQSEKVFADMELVEKTCKESHELVVLLNSPIVNTDTKISITNAIFKDKVTPLTTAFLNIILAKHREHYIPSIATEFVIMYKNYKGIQVAYLTTAVAIDDTTRAKILDLVTKQSGKQVELVEQIDAKVIGGFVLRFGDSQVDTSIASKMRELHKEFEKNLYVKEY